MKKINIIYWISTGLLCLVMGGGAIPDLIKNPEAIAMLVNHLHYPEYFGTFISIAKVLGTITILFPGFPKIKEWAYAGFTFDLIGAVYSAIAVGDPPSQWIFIIIVLAVLAISYIYHHKRLKAKQLLH